MKYLIAGLGNMDPPYMGTRHNIGFEVADAIAEKLSTSFQVKSLAHLATGSYKGRKLIVIKPTTYMNLSGKAIRYWLEKEHIPIENLIVILDDLNLDFGAIRLRSNGSHGGHNGLKDIQEQLNTSEYSRVRIGIGSQFAKGKQVNFVLGKWNEEEKIALPQLIQTAADAALSICFSGIHQAMNQFNSKKENPPKKSSPPDPAAGNPQ